MGPRHKIGGRHAARKMAPLAVPILAAAAATLVVAASASAATTYQVSGEQTSLTRGGQDRDARQPGRRLDDTSFNEIAKAPVFQAKGTELFAGCLDVRLDGRARAIRRGR